MIVGGYSLHLYCDGVGCQTLLMAVHPPVLIDERATAEFAGANERACMAEARRCGWRFVRDCAVCPRCVKVGNAVGESS